MLPKVYSKIYQIIIVRINRIDNDNNSICLIIKCLYISTHELILNNWKGVNYYENKIESDAQSVSAYPHFF